MKKTVFFLAYLCPLATFAQWVQLDSVDIVAQRRLADRYVYYLDSTSLHFSAAENLGDVLQKQSSLNININGFFGQVNSPSVGGLGSDHVKVHWEGVELNQLTLGSYDLSLFPTFLASEVQINTGSDFNTINTGAFGAGINILSNQNPKQAFTLGAGSFGYQRASLQIAEKIGKVAFNIRPYFINGQNNFNYREKQAREWVVKRAEHNALQQQGIESTVNIGKKWGGGLWTQSRNKQLPQTLLQNKDSKAVQLDKNTRVFARFEPSKQWFLQSDYSHDALSYRDKLSSNHYDINSNIIIERFGLNARHRKYIGPLKIEAQSQILAYHVKSSGFSSPVNQWRSHQHLSVFYKKKYFFAQSTVKVIGIENNPWQSTLTGSLGWRKNGTSISYGIGQRFRAPDFNDLFWAQGGNPDLLNEEGYSQHALILIEKKHTLSVKATHTELKNQIQWVPGPQFWSPINIGMVRSLNLDLRWNRVYAFKHIKLNSSAYLNLSRAQTFNSSTESFNQAQVPYLPGYKLGSNQSISWNNKECFISAYHMSSRFTDFENDPLFALDAYTSIDVGYAQDYTLGNTPIRAQISVNNVLNNTRMLALSRPNPGRYFRLAITFSLNQNQ